MTATIRLMRFFTGSTLPQNLRSTVRWISVPHESATSMTVPFVGWRCLGVSNDPVFMWAEYTKPT